MHKVIVEFISDVFAWLLVHVLRVKVVNIIFSTEDKTLDIGDAQEIVGSNVYLRHGYALKLRASQVEDELMSYGVTQEDVDKYLATVGEKLG